MPNTFECSLLFLLPRILVLPFANAARVARSVDFVSLLVTGLLIPFVGDPPAAFGQDKALDVIPQLFVPQVLSPVEPDTVDHILNLAGFLIGCVWSRPFPAASS